jgi:hypothetical protein
MKLQYLCHPHPLFVTMGVIGFSMAWVQNSAHANAPAHDYPTVARVEYVNECIGKNGGKLAALYQCSCAIDKIADALTYDDFVEQSTFSKYATLPGEGGGIFRDSDRAKKLSKTFRELEAGALRSCGVAN